MPLPLRLALVLLVVLFGVTPGQARYGQSIDGKLKYPSDFKHFSYASPNAVKGGQLVLHSIGEFDKMNPFTLKGEAPDYLEKLVFEPLAVASWDEPFSQYGLIAKDIKVAPDKMSMIFTLNTKARFSDGTPVTVEDIAYSLKTLKGPMMDPHYRFYYKDISGSEILDTTHIRFLFSKANRELPMIASQLPIFSPHSFARRGKGDDGLTPPIGSGPYVVAKIDQGNITMIYKRNPKYWARDLPVRKGMFNFDTIKVKYFKDQVVSLEAFKAGEFDFMSINIAKQWARDLAGPKFLSGKLVKKIYPQGNPAGMQGFLMNTRKTIFADRRVRQAIGLAFDFEWTNKALFYGEYTRTNSYFANSYLAAKGLPTGLELQYLEPFRKQLPPEVFTRALKAPVAEGRSGLRKNLIKAQKLLAQAGWTVKNEKLVNAEGQPFSFEILLVSQNFGRVMAPFVRNLQRLGMQVDYRSMDPALYVERLRNFNFDMIVTTYGESLSPGNEQRSFWQSSAADRPGSANYAGIKSPVVDALVDRVIYARNTEQLTAACHALDRVLWYGYYVVPNWYMSGYRLAYRNKFQRPQVLPKYYSADQLLMTWWVKQ